MKVDNLKLFVGGVTLAGKRLPNGRLQAYYGKGDDNYEIDDWPEEVDLCGNRYTLEEIIKGDDGYEAAEYV